MRTRTSRWTGAPTAPNIRRNCRFQPWVSVARYQTSWPGGGRSRAPSRSTSISVIDRSAPTVASPSSSATPPRSASTCSASSGVASADRVLTLDAVARVEDPVGPRPVVGQQEHPLGILVETADRVEPGPVGHQRRRDEVEHGRVGVAVTRRRGDTGRLVQDEVGLRGGGTDDPAVDRDDRPLGVDLAPDRRRLAVDRHPARGDQRLGTPARGDAGGGQHLLEPLLRHQPARPRRRDGHPSSRASPGSHRHRTARP